MKERSRSWLKLPYGKKLRMLHAWNAWTVLLLAVSGIVLYIPSIRGELGVVRVVLKQVHIWLGVLSILLLALYVPLIRNHVRQIRGKPRQMWNLGLVVALLLGWSLSGLVLWQFRHLPTAWSNTALLVHDLISWIGIPYAIFHSITRSRWLKEDARSASAKSRSGIAPAADAAEGAAVPGGPATPEEAERRSGLLQLLDNLRRNPPMSRRTFLTSVVGIAIVAIVGPRFVRWLGSGFLSSIDGDALQNAYEDANRLLPAPAPMADSSPPVGGGLQGSFRIYTVTEMPVFTNANWSFRMTGLIDNPQQWNWGQFLQLERTVQVSDFHCVTGWSVRRITWEGIPLSRLIAMAGNRGARFVKFYSGDGVYTDALSLEQAVMDDVMVAVMMDGMPIPRDLGGPVRLVVPKMYAYKSVKWLERIELTNEDHVGYWEERGYSKDAWV